MHIVTLLNNAKFWLSYKTRSLSVSSPPLVLNIEPTNFCNLRCPFCPVSQNAKNPEVSRGFMPLHLAEKICDEVKAWRPMIALNLGGESSLHSALPDLIKIFSSAGCYVFMDTNAVLLKHDISDQLVNSGLNEITFCIDGEGDEESYSSMRKRGDFHRAIANARYFIRASNANKNQSVKTVVKNIRYYLPGQELSVPNPIMELFGDDQPSTYRATWADYWPGTHAENLKDGYEVQPYNHDDYQACTNLWKKMAISWDGNVYICCLDLNRTMHIGNVGSSNVLDIWNGPEFRFFRQMHKDGRQAELSLCKSCTMVRRQPVSRMAGLIRLRNERFTEFSDQKRV